MNTSEDGYELIKMFEGCKLTAYRPVPGGNWTIGWGNEGKLYDGRPIVEGMTISQQEADDDFAFTMYNEVDPLVRSYFNTQSQDEFDACASWIYNINWPRLRQGRYSLPDIVNQADRSADTVDAIIDKWLQYHKTPGAYDGLYRRRIIELCKFMSLPWNTPAILGTVRTIKAGEDPEPVFQMAEAIYDQMNVDDQTAALNNAQLEKLGGTPEQPVPKGTPSVKPKKAKAVETPKLNPSAEPKPMEQSTTAKGMAQQKAGADQVIVGTVTTTMAGVATAREVTKGIKEVNATAADVRGILFGITIEQLAMLGLLVGAIWLTVGVIRWQTGRIRKAVGRAEATEAKI